MLTFRQIGFPALVAVTACLLISCQPVVSTERIYEQESPYSFADTLQNLDIAISEHNYRIIHRSDIGGAIRERGEADFPLSTVVSFCNISYARDMMLINPVLINEMPCNVTVRETGDGRVIVGARLMAVIADTLEERRFADKINGNLKDIIGATVE